MSQMSTAVSDGLLALSAFHAAYRLYHESFCAVAGFALVGFAATFGAFRFGSRAPSGGLVDAHLYMSWLGSVLGMSCLAAAYQRQATVYFAANAHLAAAMSLIVVASLLSDHVHSAVSEVISGVAIVAIAVLSGVRFNPFGLIGAAVYACAGLVVGTRGYWLGVARVDWFHYLLIVGNVALMLGLVEQGSPLYYRPAH